MTPIDIPELLQASAINVITGIVTNAFWIILIIVIYLKLKKQIKETGKSIVVNIPKWLEDYKSIISNQNSINQAQDFFKRNKG